MSNATRPPRRMRFSFESRCRIVQLIAEGMSPQAAAAACGASRATGYRIWRRYQQGGWEALLDRSSRPRRQPRRLCAEAEAEILAWREHLQAGPAVIAAVLERPISTVGKVLRRAGRSRLPRPQRDPKVRYERAHPGELLHVDTKKLGRFFQVGKAILRAGSAAAAAPAGSTCTSRSTTTRGWPTVNCCLPTGRPTAPPSSPARSPGPPSRGSRSRVSSATTPGPTTPTSGATAAPSSASNAATPGPYSPWTNGKAEPLIKTLLREWAYRFAYPSSSHRSRALAGFTRWYNRRRPHGSLGGRPPISRVSHLCGHYS
jgi:transposase